MSTSDQHGQGPLTRKQLREIRLTGSTPVITDEVAAANPTPSAEPAPAEPTSAETPPAVDQEAPAVDAAPEAAEQTPDAVIAAPDVPAPDLPAPDLPAPGVPLTRRQVRDRERVRTASVPVVEPAAEPEIAAEVSAPMPADVDSDVDDAEIVVEPVSAVGASSSFGDVQLEVVEDDREQDDVDDVLGLVPDADADESDEDDVLADVDPSDDAGISTGERPTVNPAFGAAVIEEERKPFAPSFDDLLSVNDSSGSQHTSPSTLIFTPAAGDGSLSGPVASTGEILVTGSYELPRGMGSQGHAHGVADGKDVDAVLVDGELPPASSPTPIAASSAVSTIKPAGEVIRPPAPEKGNKLMLVLSIVAGGLALALTVVLVVAFTTNVF